MEAASEQKSVYLRAFEAGQPGSGWLGERRRAAIEAFERQGFPTRRWEAWKHARLEPLTQASYPLAPTGGELATELAELSRQVPEAVRLVFVDGYFRDALSDTAALPEGVRVSSLADALNEGNALAETAYGLLADPEANPFVALNTAFATDGALIDVAPDTMVDRPLVLFFATSAGAAGHAAYPRVLLRAGRGAELRLVQHHAGAGADSHVICPVTELYLEDNAGLRLQHLQDEGPGAWHLGVIHARLARDSRLDLHTVTSGGRFGRTDIHVDLCGPGAEATMNGLYLVDAGRYADYHTWVRHFTDHGRSDQLFKGVLRGKCESVFDGMIHVAKGAQQTDSQQQNNNLLLSPMALAHSNPRLEIYADDVKCAHGSTVGELDKDAVFYLRTRGVGEADARGLLTFAFANEVLDSMVEPALGDHMRERLFALLPGDYTVRSLV